MPRYAWQITLCQQGPYSLICFAGYSSCADCSSLFSSLETDTVPDSLDAMLSTYYVCSTDIPVTGWLV